MIIGGSKNEVPNAGIDENAWKWQAFPKHFHTKTAIWCSFSALHACSAGYICPRSSISAFGGSIAGQQLRCAQLYGSASRSLRQISRPRSFELRSRPSKLVHRSVGLRPISLRLRRAGGSPYFVFHPSGEPPSKGFALASRHPNRSIVRESEWYFGPHITGLECKHS